MIQQAIYQLVNGQDLSLAMARDVMDEIMQGQATGAQIGSFLTALRTKGETTQEITACAQIMRKHCTKLHHDHDVLEIVGTGGDEANTFNISTVSALVVSAAGVPVAKHGNRSVSSKCGAADLLEALGVKIDLTADQCAAVLKQTGICFMFAPLYHASMKYAAPVRKELGIRTIFNILGPLANPAGATLQLLGVYDENLVEPMARVLANLGVRRAMVVHGHDGLDEATMTGTSTVCEVSGDKLNSFFLDPKQFGFTLCRPADLVGGDPKDNAVIAREVLSGQKGPKRDVVLFNAAICLYMAKGSGTLRQCVHQAEDIIDSGKAKAQLERFIQVSNEVAT